MWIVDVYCGWTEAVRYIEVAIRDVWSWVLDKSDRQCVGSIRSESGMFNWGWSLEWLQMTLEPSFDKSQTLIAKCGELGS